MKNVADFYPLSPMQAGMLFHSLYAPDSGVYVEQVSCTLRGDLDVTAFERAWQRVVDRHPVLRTAFRGEGLKEPVQVVRRQVKLPLAQQDWRGLSPSEQECELRDFLAQDRRTGFDLAQAPLMRLALMRSGEDACTFVWTHHHILLDGWSIPQLLQEVFALYEAFRRGEDLHLEPPRPYRDYIAWLKHQNLAEAEAFWRRTLAGFSTPTPLVIDRPRDHVADDGARPAEHETRLSVEATAALQDLARQHHLTLNTLMQGAWGLLLSRYNSEEDVVFGSTVSGRPGDLPGSEYMVGLFINTLPVRVQVAGNAELVAWLKELQSQLVEARQYEYSPLVQIQGWSEVPRGTPLFESILVFENYPVATSIQAHEGSLAIEDIRSVEQTNYPLTVVGGPAEQLVLKAVYDCHRFDGEAIGRMLEHLRTLLESMSSDPDQRLCQLPLLTDAERNQILVEWNDTQAEYPQDKCAHELFETQVQRTPEAIAVTLEEEHLTYQTLNQRANQLAHRLQTLGVEPDTVVGICVERSLEMVIGILGILKAGGAYLPLDPTYPPERLTYILQDAQVQVLLTQSHLVGQLDALRITHHASRSIVCLDTDQHTISQEPTTNPSVGMTPENLAYVIYTSGSTGRPKGTLLHHRGLCNFATSQAHDYDLEAGRRMLQFASFSFDGSVAEIFPALVSGATLCLAHREVLLSSPDLLQLLRNQRITTAIIPPSMLAILPAEDLPALQTLLSAGEACTRDIVERWAPGRRFINAYGPTEATVGPTYYLVENLPDEITNVPIGRPIVNTQIYILDPRLQPVPVGVPGELMVGGVGVARGYLNRPELTAQKFIPDPFSTRPGARLYRTGDLARYLPDGDVEFLGRVDHQVKVRGFRIELGEIEAALSEHPAIHQAVALAREDRPGIKRLVAYVVPEQGPAPTAGELRDFLSQKLPQHMVPTAFVVLDELPLTPNRKVDRQALPAPAGDRPEMEETYVAPRDRLELQLTQIWETVLDVRPIGVNDDFFKLGGHSLLAVRLVAQIQQRFSQTVPLHVLFQEPTIEHLAGALRQQGRPEQVSPLVEIQADGSRPPVFFVHPSGGSVHWYADLARHLGPDQPFFGLQAQGLYGDQELHTRIEDMAAYYVAAMRESRPDGPYLLGSWSMGVAVAFEMAQQLHAQGQEVALLALLDQGPTLPTEEPEDDAAYLMDVFGKHLPLSLEHLRQLGPDEQVAHVWEEARKANWIYPDITLPQFHHFVHILRTHTEAWRKYEPRVYPGHITLFRASEQPGDGPLEPDLGWGRLASGGVEVYEVPGDHLSMIHEPDVQFLAARMKECIPPSVPPASGGEGEMEPA